MTVICPVFSRRICIILSFSARSSLSACASPCVMFICGFASPRIDDAFAPPTLIAVLQASKNNAGDTPMIAQMFLVSDNPWSLLSTGVGQPIR